jgi:hypothetical protein
MAEKGMWYNVEVALHRQVSENGHMVEDEAPEKA